MRMSALPAVAAAIVAAMLLPAAPAGALSLGIYGTVGGGLSDGDQYGTGRYDDQRDTTHGGYGFVIDTAGPRDLLSYRLGVGYEKIVHEEDFDSERLVLRGIVVDQDLTLDLIGSRHLRVWFGPELRLGAFRGEPDADPAGRVTFASVGIGPVAGFDYQLGPSLALSWKLGYLMSGYAGTQRTGYANDRNSSIAEGHAYLTLAILFQTWENERAERAEPSYRYPRR